MATIETLKKGDFFTINPLENPTEKQVYIFDGYNRSTRNYSSYKFNDVNEYREFKKERSFLLNLLFKP